VLSRDTEKKIHHGTEKKTKRASRAFNSSVPSVLLTLKIFVRREDFFGSRV
jgi:hypothetical protein